VNFKHHGIAILLHKNLVIRVAIPCDTGTAAQTIVVRPPLSQIVRRAGQLHCPYCGRGGLFRGVFRMYSRCPECGLSYFPEQGYYLGAMIINYAATTACVVTIYLVSLLFPDFTTLSINMKILLWMIFAVLLSLLLVRHAYSFWLGLDFWIKPRRPDPPTE
jgi:uncharacterized protein (DUF983 family)